jgi:predicted nucleic acid-binding protein
MTGRVFLDTNILVYLFDENSPDKKRSGHELVRRLAEELTTRVISTQVLQEAYSSMTRKLGLDPASVLTLLREMEGSGIRVQVLDPPLIWRAATRSINDKLSFWDGLIVESAIAAQCSVLYTEDMQHGRTFGSVTVRNPFN